MVGFIRTARGWGPGTAASERRAAGSPATTRRPTLPRQQGRGGHREGGQGDEGEPCQLRKGDRQCAVPVPVTFPAPPGPFYGHGYGQDGREHHAQQGQRRQANPEVPVGQGHRSEHQGDGRQCVPTVPLR